MPIELTTIIAAAFPGADGCFDPPQVSSPEGITYQWANTTLMGSPDLVRLQQRLDNGWSFVPPGIHPELPTVSMAEAIQCRAFCLVQKPTALIEEQRARERAAHMDVDIRALSILERYTGDAPRVTIRGVSMRVSAKKRLGDGTPAAPIASLDEVRSELARHGFPHADVRLFMQRHFGKDR